MISLIAAVARNGVIGKDNALLWHLSEDMRYFRETTLGRPVIMGRRTWESLPERFRPLPGRRNVVVTRKAGYAAPGAFVANSLADAIEAGGLASEIFVIGGADLYRQAIAIADKLYLTEIYKDYEGDVFFPKVLPREWREVSRRPRADESFLDYDFVVYERRKTAV
jgi:dihydrofolate reductase